MSEDGIYLHKDNIQLSPCTQAYSRESGGIEDCIADMYSFAIWASDRTTSRVKVPSFSRPLLWRKWRVQTIWPGSILSGLCQPLPRSCHGQTVCPCGKQIWSRLIEFTCVTINALACALLSCGSSSRYFNKKQWRENSLSLMYEALILNNYIVSLCT